MKSLVKLNFNPEVARLVGERAAIIFENIAYWVEKNAMNQMDKDEKPSFKDGRWWTYNSIKAFKRQFYWLSEKQIRLSLKRLENEGLIVTNNYNNNPHDRTKWYALGDNPICRKGQMHLPEWANGIAQTGECNIRNTNEKTNERIISTHKKNPKWENEHIKTSEPKPTNDSKPKSTLKGKEVKGLHLPKPDELTDKDFESIAKKYEVPLEYVRDKWDDVLNYCLAKNKMYARYNAVLANWVKRDKKTGKHLKYRRYV